MTDLDANVNIPQDLLDEIISINSIYSGDTLSIISTETVENEQHSRALCEIKPPQAVINPIVTLHILFPADYPNSAPEIIHATTNGKGLSQKELERTSGEILEGIWSPGMVVLFEFIETLKEKVDNPISEKPADAQGESTIHQEPYESQGVTNISKPKEDDKSVSVIPWANSEPVIQQKSVFIGRAVQVESPEQAKSYVDELIATDKKVAKATHNITDNDDDGETAAGSRLAHLLEIIDVWNVMVVVSRWYGGIHLGPDRFRLINQAAREALDAGGFIETAESDKQKNKGKGKGKK